MMPTPAHFFPYPRPRQFQEELMHRIFTADAIIASAPTGVGKTIAALCSFLADRLPGERIVVLTRTKSQARIFMEETRAISGHITRPLLAVHLRSKQELCPVFGDDAGYEEFLQLCKLKRDCEHRRRFRERLDEIPMLAERLAAGDEVSLINYGCPHAVAMELARFADVVIASYNYLLSPFLRSTFLAKLGNAMEELLVIVDEAHNLQNMDLLSRRLSRRSVELAAKELNYDFSGILGLFSGKDELLAAEELISAREVEFLYRRGVEVLERRLRKGRKVSYTYRVASFLRAALKLSGDENWVFFRQGGRLFLKPLFPAELVEPLKRARKLLLMSGTLEPEMYAEMLNIKAETCSIPGIYRDNLYYLGIRSGLSTSLAERQSRGDELWRSYAGIIKEIQEATPGITLVFFPSYEVLASVRRYFTAPAEPRDSAGAEELISRLRGRQALFAVAGGKLSEGVEFTVESEGGKRSLVKSVVIAGFPFPVPDFEMELRRRAFERRYGAARAFAFLSLLPMINRVLQSAGRAVRSARDRACVVLLDDRIEYLRYFPEELRHEVKLVELEELAAEVRWFHSH
ncbi:ATP-dependent DNA helicase [Candidatus Pyrohabitans sp.]